MSKSVYSKEYKIFRLMLAETRTEKGLTQAELAKLINRPQSFVSKYELGERRLDVIEFLEIAMKLKINVEHFLKDLQIKASEE